MEPDDQEIVRYSYGVHNHIFRCDDSGDLRSIDYHSLVPEELPVKHPGNTIYIRYKNAITFLTNVAKGLANIDTGQDTADGSGTATANDGFRYRANERLFSRETMKGY